MPSTHSRRRGFPVNEPWPGSSPPLCHLCRSGDVVVASGGDGWLSTVTSDCRPWPLPARLVVCRTCGTSQKDVHSGWEADVAQIYRTYGCYEDEGGREQRVFDQSSGVSKARSEILAAEIAARIPLGGGGRLLDIGCGSGVLLRTFSEAIAAGTGAPAGWAMVGTELGERYRATVEGIPGVERMHVGPLSEVGGTFCVVTIVHVLEHIVDPLSLLGTARRMVAPGGILVVCVPDYRKNAFDLVVADHATHFGPESLHRLLLGAGFRPVRVAEQEVPKEIVVVATPDGEPGSSPLRQHRGSAFGEEDDLRSALDWLHSMRRGCEAMPDDRPAGIFGSTIAATWLADATPRLDFFVDEDPARVGTRHLGRPIISPDDVPAGAQVLVGLPTSPALAVAGRLRRAGVEYLVPSTEPA